MQGEFRGDFTRDTYNPSKQFLRVFMQQGRVQLDADWNEQVSILLNYLQTLATDLIGPYGGPQNNCGFEIFPATQQKLDELSLLTDANKQELEAQLKNLPNEEKINFLIGVGHYYVYGKLCHNQKYVLYSKQNYSPFSVEEKLEEGKTYLVYLDVWERHISYLEDENELVPGIREIALGKADTTTRSQLIWQIKVKPIAKTEDLKAFVKDIKENTEKLREIIKGNTEPVTRNEIKPGTGLLKVQAKIPAGADVTNPCTISPDSRYRGAENQLYRVEIHQSGEVGEATFKWSCENGSAIFPVQQAGDKNITLGHLGWDDRSSLKSGDWVELVDDNYLLQGRAEPLLQVDSIDSMEMTVKLKNPVSGSSSEGLHPLLRRWDQQESSDIKFQEKQGTIPVVEKKWIELEKGIEIQFCSSKEGFYYATGDYWLIPARTATGDVEWLKERQGDKLVPVAVPPHGIEHHYAPLSVISVGQNGEITPDGDCRCKFPSICQLTDKELA